MTNDLIAIEDGQKLGPLGIGWNRESPIGGVDIRAAAFSWRRKSRGLAIVVLAGRENDFSLHGQIDGHNLLLESIIKCRSIKATISSIDLLSFCEQVHRVWTTINRKFSLNCVHRGHRANYQPIGNKV